MRFIFHPGAAALLSAAILSLAGCATTKPCRCVCANPAQPAGANSARGKLAPKATGSATAVRVQAFVMSKCPFAAQAQAGLLGLKKKLGDRLQLRFDYIVTRENGRFSALHGQPEVEGNIKQLCVQKYYPQKIIDFIACQNRDFEAIPKNWRSCAKSLDLAVDKLETCAKGDEGKNLLTESMQRANDANAKGSPTILVAGKAYQGGREANDFLRAACPAFPGDRPTACGDLPPQREVNLLVLNDQRCKSCATANFEKNLKHRFFPKLIVKQVDYGTEEGKKLFAAVGVKRLPALIFDATVTKAEKYGAISRWIKQRGEHYVLKMPATFDPTAEICDNKKDDTGDGKIDCQDPTCKARLVCRKEIKRKVDIFVMSQCPFGAQALLAMDEVLKNFKGKVAFDVHYIADQKDDGSFSALHGQPEVDENIRQLCAKAVYGKKDRYLKYVYCRSNTYRSNDWKGCAKGGISAQKITQCATKRGDKLLSHDIKLAAALRIAGSPTFLANNRHKFHGVTPEKIKNEVCKHNPGLVGCKNKLTDTAPGPTGSCGN